MNKPLVEKYRPQEFRDIQGNNKDLKELRSWAENFQRGDQAQRLAGSAGVGKTSAAHVISNEMGWPKEEINASDARRTDEIRSIAERMKLRPVGAEYQLVILDEADSIPGSTNLNPLTEVLEEPSNPIIIICNEDYKVPDPIQRLSNKREFSLSSGSRQAKLREIAKEEEIDIGPATLSDLADRKNLRDAIHDLQVMVRGDGELMEDTRQYEDNPFDITEKIVRGQTGELPMLLPDSPDEFIWWVDENIRDELRGVEAQVAYDLLARADKWLERARREDYRYWKYATRLIKQTSAVRLTQPYSGYIQMNYPSAKRKWAPSSRSDSGKAQLYRVLSGEDGRFGLGCNYLEFRKQYLPILLDLPLEERREMANEHGLDDAAQKALDLDPDQYEEWRKSEGSKMEEGSVFEW